MPIREASSHDHERALVVAAERGDAAARRRLEIEDIIRGNPASPAGEYARFLAARAMGGVRSPGAGSGLRLSNGELLQVRGRHVKPHRRPKYWSLDFDPQTETFNAAVVVLFATDFSVYEAWLVPWDALGRLVSKYDGTGYRLRVDGRWRADASVVSVAHDLARAA